jgi:hypothetical protein
MTVSLAALGIAAALLITTAPRTSWFMSLLLGGVVGLFPPVSYGLWLGQANLLILPLLALAFRGVYPGLTLMLASGVKIYPITGLVALWDRPDRWKQMALASAAGLAILLLQWPVGLPAISNLGPDAYWSNQSINGFLSRLALVPGWIPSDAPLGAIDLGLVVVLGYFTLRLLARARFQPFTGVLALSLWFGSVAAPKNSLWNFVPLLLCLALGLQQARRHPGPAITMFLSVCLMGIQLIVWGVTLRGGAIPRSEYANPWVLWTSSLGLMAALFIGAATARLISARERV